MGSSCIHGEGSSGRTEGGLNTPAGSCPSPEPSRPLGGPPPPPVSSEMKGFNIIIKLPAL